MRTTPTSGTLTEADRCDRCGAAARVRAVLAGGGQLMFCVHHANVHSSRLRALNALLVVEKEPAG